MREESPEQNIGEHEKRILARWVNVFLPAIVKDLQRDGKLEQPPSPDEAEVPRFKFGHEAYDGVRCKHQMLHESFEIVSPDNRWLAEEAIRCPRCGKVTLDVSPSACSGCGMSIPRRNHTVEPPVKASLPSKAMALIGGLGIAAIIAVGISSTYYLFKANHNVESIPLLAVQEHGSIPGEWRSIRSALRVVEHFHQAGSVEEKASLIRDFTGRVESLSDYYKSRPFEPSRVANIVKTGWMEMEGLVSYLIHGQYENGKAFLAYVCEQDGKLALDWQAFTGHNALPFTEFLDEETADPVDLRVVVQGISVEPFPELAQDYRFYQLHDKTRSDTCWALVKKHSEAGQILESLISPPKAAAFSLLSTTSDTAAETSSTPPRRLILKMRHDDTLGIVIDKVVSTEWLDLPVPADVHFDV